MNAHSRRVLVKRILDTILIFSLAPVLAPLLAASAVVVLVSMGRPIVFTQPRIGLNGRQFRVLKFRTMSNQRDAGGALLPDRERLTRVGRVLRKLSLDELPQVINVVRGDMSLVGPRPLLVEYLPHYRERERIRHLVRPGITGAAQIAGRNGLLWDERLKLDADYAEFGTLRDDVRIVGATLKSVLTSVGVSVIAGDSGERLDVVRSYPSDGDYALRRLELQDAATRVSWFHDARISAYMSVPQDVTEEGTREWIVASRLQRTRKDLVLYETVSGRVRAMLGVRSHNHPDLVEVHILVDPDRKGQGLGTIAMGLLLAWLRQQKELRGCWLTVHPENEPALRLYERLGFVRVSLVAPDRLKMELVWD